MVFLFKLTICWGLFALLYTLLLRQETFFRLNRIYLLGTAALGILLAGASERLLPALTDETGVAYTMLPEFTLGLQQTETLIRQWDYIDYVWVIYWAGVIVTCLRTVWGIARLFNMAVRGQKEHLPDGCILIQTTETVVPFSFFKWVFVPLPKNHSVIVHSEISNPSAVSQAATHLELRTSNFKLPISNSELILAHERAHAHGWHSADVLWAELLCIAFWFHPLAHWYRRTLRTVHEYLADAEVARHADKKQYGLLLIQQAQSGPALALVHHFFQSPLKQRLIMLMRQHSAPVRALRYGLVLPLLLLVGLLFQQNPELAQTAPQKEGTTTGDDAPAQFPGGQAALMKYLSEQIKYPEAARKANASGMAVIAFMVETDGSITKVSSLKDNIAQELQDEAIRVVKGMPKWVPAIKEGKIVKTEMTLPIRFKL